MYKINILNKVQYFIYLMVKGGVKDILKYNLRTLKIPKSWINYNNFIILLHKR